MNAFFQESERKTALLTEYWEREYGPFDRQAEWPHHPRPCCFDCAGSYRYDRQDRIRLEDVRPATTFYDAYEARYLLCERCWRARMRGDGYTEAEIRAILIAPVGGGGFAAEEADRLLAEDAPPPETRRAEEP